MIETLSLATTPHRFINFVKCSLGSNGLPFLSTTSKVNLSLGFIVWVGPCGFAEVDLLDPEG
jgi:hypothetical protein